MTNVDRAYEGERWGPHPDEVIADLAGARNGVVARWQLVRARLTPGQIEARVASGHLRPLHRGVYAVGHGALGPRSLRHAAWLAIGPDAVVSHHAAAAEHDLRRDVAGSVDVTAPRYVRARRGIRPHEARLALADRAVVDGLPITSWPRTALDLAALLPLKEVTRLLERADKLDLYDGRALDDVIERHNGHRGTGILKRAIAAVDPRHHDTRSDWERDVLPLLDALDLPRPKINAPLGPYIVDLHWPEHKVVVELDSFEHHRDRSAFEADRARDRWLAARGISCLRFTWRQVERGALSELAGLLRVPPR